MKFYYYHKLVFTIILIYIIIPIKSVAVCDLATLKMELLQDINDNGMLDCKKHSPEQREDESEINKIKRVSSKWDSSCSFESSQNWLKDLKDYYGINYLVNSIGEPYEFNPKEEADMCVIIRTILHKRIPNLTMYKIPENIINEINCPGNPNSIANIYDIDRKKICAATGGSFFDAKGWSIFLQPSFINIGNINKPESIKPKFINVISGKIAQAKSSTNLK